MMAGSSSCAEAIRLETVQHCPLCEGSGWRVVIDGVEDHQRVVSGAFRFVECSGCGLIYQNPKPVDDDIVSCYKKYYTHESRPLPASFAGPWTGPTRWIRGGVLAKKFGYSHLGSSRPAMLFACLLDLLPAVRRRTRCYLGAGSGSALPTFSPPGRALDVGTGDGKYAAILARLGWEVVGVDFDDAAARAAAEAHGLEVRVGRLDEMKFADQSFDFISMFHLVEHLPDPVRSLRECHRILRPGGRIMIRTPNYDSLTRRVFKRHWRGLEPPRHLCLYTIRTLTRLLEATGFRVSVAVSSQSGTLWNVRSTMQIRAADGGGAFSPLSARCYAACFKLAALLARPGGKLFEDELHVVAVRDQEPILRK